MTWSMLLRMLTEAEARVANESLPEDVRERSAETVSLCKERMAREGVTLEELKQLAFEESREGAGYAA